MNKQPRSYCIKNCFEQGHTAGRNEQKKIQRDNYHLHYDDYTIIINTANDQD